MFINNHKMLCKFIKRFVSKNMEYGFATTDKPILVTGASGFIASNLVRKLL
jgi:FlaA1/EpsC-like NDP-sugar epimerase